MTTIKTATAYKAQIARTSNQLDRDVRYAVVERLNEVLSGLLDTCLAARHAHWNVRGPSFLAMHKVFGDVAVELDRHADEVAERAAALGGMAEGTIQAVVRDSALVPYPAMAVSQWEHAEAMSLRLGALADIVRRAAKCCDTDDDPVSSHVLLETAKAVEKSLWLVESHRITSS